MAKQTTHNGVAGHQSGCTRSQISFVGPHHGWRTFLRQLIRKLPLRHDLILAMQILACRAALIWAECVAVGRDDWRTVHSKLYQRQSHI